MRTRLLELGRALFRWRSLTPVPVLVCLLFLLWATPPIPVHDTVELLLVGLGALLAVAGETLRVWTLGQVPEGTSGQGSELQAERLNTQGPYAYVRNPLYLGNLFICLGLLIAANNGWVDAVALLFFWAQYFLIIRAEEAFLLEKYRAEFQEYAQRVPRWRPRLSPAYRGKLRSHFDLRRALRKEHNPFAAWATGLLFLIAWRSYGRGALTPALLVALGLLELAVLAFFVLVKGLKHGWFGRSSARFIYGPSDSKS